MNENQTTGLSSISLSRPVFIQSCASVVGKKEGEGPLGDLFDLVCEEPMFGSDTWELSLIHISSVISSFIISGESPADLARLASCETLH